MSRLEDDVYSFGLILLQSIVGPSVSAREEAFLRDELVRFSQDRIHKPDLKNPWYLSKSRDLCFLFFRHRWRARKEGGEW